MNRMEDEIEPTEANLINIGFAIDLIGRYSPRQFKNGIEAYEWVFNAMRRAKYSATRDGMALHSLDDISRLIFKAQPHRLTTLQPIRDRIRAALEAQHPVKSVDDEVVVTFDLGAVTGTFRLINGVFAPPGPPKRTLIDHGDHFTMETKRGG